MTKNNPPQIYVACLAAYNSGKLHGTWIDAAQDAEDVREEIQQMLKDSPAPHAEEWAIHDFENWHGLTLSEHEDIEQLAAIAQLIAKHGAAYAGYIAYMGKEYATAEAFQDIYCGEHDSEADFAEQHYRECQSIPAFLESYIDWEHVANDLFISDFFSVTCDGSTHVFRRH